MKRPLIIGLFLTIVATLLSLIIWPYPNTIRHDTEADLAGLTCAELSKKHNKVIVAYHDASIARHRKTGSFGDGLGLPAEDVLPIIIVMKKVIRDNNFAGFDLTKPFFHSKSATAPKRHSDFYAEVSNICATYPAMQATTAMLQAAQTLE